MATGDDDRQQPDEPRVRDLLAGGSRGAVEDPQTIAQLEAWFGLPSFDQLEERAAAAPPEPSVAEQIQRRRAEALAHIDPALFARLDRQAQRAAHSRVRLFERPWDADRRLTIFDETQVPPAFDEDEVNEVPIPHELRRDLQTCTPQAFLRDLHRPEKEFYVRMQPPWDDWDGEVEPAQDPMAPVRDTIRRDYRVGTTVPPVLETMAEAWSDRRRWMARPWAESKRERARQREAELLAEMSKMEADAGKEASRGPVAGKPGRIS